MKAQDIPTPLESLPDKPSQEQIKQAVNYVMSYNDLDESFYRVAECESNFYYYAYGDYDRKSKTYKAYGIFQFHKPTWNYFQKLSGLKLNYYSTKDQIKMALWAWKNGKQNHWSCWLRLYK